MTTSQPGSGGRGPLTVLVEQLMDGGLLRVEEQRGHVVIGSVGAEELTDGRVDVFSAPHLQRSKVTHRGINQQDPQQQDSGGV